MPQKKREEQHIRQMADMLRQGATLTELGCPACASPLFRLRGEGLWCVKCQKKVVVMKEGDKATKIQGSIILNELEAMLLTKVQRIKEKMQHEEDVEELRKMSITLSELLDNLEKIKRSKRA